jgi:hypothetical protein
MWRRRRVLLLASAAMTVVAVVMAMQPAKAEAALRFKTVTKTFVNDTPISIPEGGQATPYPSEIPVGGFRKGRIKDVNLTLKNFSHVRTTDVDVLLVKGETDRTVMSDVGMDLTTANRTLVLDDEAANSLPADEAPTGGTYKPTNLGSPESFPAPAPTPSGASALSGFDGKRPKGIWQLHVMDDFDASGTVDSGQFAGGWSLKIKAKVRIRR